MFGLNANKLKVQCQLCLTRMKLVLNKRGGQLRKERAVVADMLRQDQHTNARIRVEAVIREEFLLRAYLTLENYLLLISTRAEYLSKTKTVPPDMIEAVNSIIFAAGRVSGDLDEIKTIAKLILPKAQASFGKEFAQEVVEDYAAKKYGVNEDLISCLSVVPPPPAEKITVLADIAEQHGIAFDKERAAAEMMAVRIPRIPSPYDQDSGPPTGGTGFGTGGGYIPPARPQPTVTKVSAPGSDWTTEIVNPHSFPVYNISQAPTMPSAPVFDSRPTAPSHHSPDGWDSLQPSNKAGVDIGQKMNSAALFVAKRRSSGGTSDSQELASNAGSSNGSEETYASANAAMLAARQYSKRAMNAARAAEILAASATADVDGHASHSVPPPPAAAAAAPVQQHVEEYPDFDDGHLDLVHISDDEHHVHDAAPALGHLPVVPSDSALLDVPDTPGVPRVDDAPAPVVAPPPAPSQPEHQQEEANEDLEDELSRRLRALRGK